MTTRAKWTNRYNPSRTTATLRDGSTAGVVAADATRLLLADGRTVAAADVASVSNASPLRRKAAR